MAATDLTGMPGAGAMADGTTVARGRLSAFEALTNHDAYPFFQETGDLVITGSTGTNVMDLHLILVS